MELRVYRVTNGDGLQPSFMFMEKGQLLFDADDGRKSRNKRALSRPWQKHARYTCFGKLLHFPFHLSFLCI